MHHPVIEKYISELKLARFPYITSDTQVLCGRVVLTASPGIDSDVVHSFRLDVPADLQPDVEPSESACWLLFLVSVFDAQIACDILSRVHPENEHEHSEVFSSVVASCPGALGFSPEPTT